MAVKASWIEIEPRQQAELGLCAASSGFHIISQDELPSVFPDRLRQKIDSALMATIPTSSGGMCLLISALRVDQKDRALDNEPFGLIVHSTGVSVGGVFIHHGDWEGRTQAAPADFWNVVEASGVGDYFYTSPPDGVREGTLDQLPVNHRGAFDAVLREIRAHNSGGS